MAHDLDVGRRARLRTEIAKINYRIRQQERLLASRMKRQAAGDLTMDLGVRSTRSRLNQLQHELAAVWTVYDELVLHCMNRNSNASASD